jgi:hypothetical protein
MSALLEELVLEQGEAVCGRISGVLGISREDAARVLPATAAVILDRFEPGTCDRGGADPHPVEAARDPERSLDGILAGTGLQLSERLHVGFGIVPEEAARTIPVLVPVILRFILRRTPYGSMASSVLSETVARQGERSLDALALRIAKKVLAPPLTLPPVKPTSVVAAILGRWSGKWFSRKRRLMD